MMTFIICLLIVSSSTIIVQRDCLIVTYCLWVHKRQLIDTYHRMDGETVVRSGRDGGGGRWRRL